MQAMRAYETDDSVMFNPGDSTRPTELASASANDGIRSRVWWCTIVAATPRRCWMEGSVPATLLGAPREAFLPRAGQS